MPHEELLGEASAPGVQVTRSDVIALLMGNGTVTSAERTSIFIDY